MHGYRYAMLGLTAHKTVKAWWHDVAQGFQMDKRGRKFIFRGSLEWN